MAVKKIPVVHATRKRLRAAYNKGYLAGRRSPTVTLVGEHGKLASEEEKTKKTEVVLNIGSVRIQINTED